MYCKKQFEKGCQSDGRTDFSHLPIMRIFAAVLCVALSFSVFGCAPSASSSSSDSSSAAVSTENSVEAGNSSVVPEGEMVVQVDIEYPNQVDPSQYQIAPSMSVSLPIDATAYDALVATGCDIVEQDGFVDSINDLGLNDIAEGSGWTYTVNGEYATVSASEFVLSNGDNVVWSFYIPEG